MNSTSRGSRLVRIAARSPARSIAGPLVWRIATPSSLATTPASVVLPSPGGPESSRWSSDSSRARAASISTPRLSFTRSWPRYSSSLRGRSERSISRSSSVNSAETSRSPSSGDSRLVLPHGAHSGSPPRTRRRLPRRSPPEPRARAPARPSERPPHAPSAAAGREAAGSAIPAMACMSSVEPKRSESGTATATSASDQHPQHHPDQPHRPRPAPRSCQQAERRAERQRHRRPPHEDPRRDPARKRIAARAARSSNTSPAGAQVAEQQPAQRGPSGEHPDPDRCRHDHRRDQHRHHAGSAGRAASASSALRSPGARAARQAPAAASPPAPHAPPPSRLSACCSIAWASSVPS